MNPGGDRVFIGLLRLPSNFEYPAFMRHKRSRRDRTPDYDNPEEDLPPGYFEISRPFSPELITPQEFPTMLQNAATTANAMDGEETMVYKNGDGAFADVSFLVDFAAISKRPST